LQGWLPLTLTPCGWQRAVPCDWALPSDRMLLIDPHFSDFIAGAVMLQCQWF
jgi:hypothetical protein